MTRKAGASTSKVNEDQEPTDEAAEKDVAIDKVAVAETEQELETDPAKPEVEVLVEEKSPIEVSPPSDPERSTLGEADPKVHVKKAKKMFRIILDEQDNADKNNDQLVTDPSNGKQYLIKRGFEVDVPEGVVNNLRESVIDRLEYDANGEEVWRSIPRFAMRVIKELN